MRFIYNPDVRDTAIEARNNRLIPGKPYAPPKRQPDADRVFRDRVAAKELENDAIDRILGIIAPSFDLQTATPYGH